MVSINGHFNSLDELECIWDELKDSQKKISTLEETQKAKMKSVGTQKDDLIRKNDLADFYLSWALEIFSRSSLEKFEIIEENFIYASLKGSSVKTRLSSFNFSRLAFSHPGAR